ncbi:hypothetical protein GCM10027429_21370 [Marivirga atlantica]|uniref:Uncharacterized protein n=1 Tax=Marivirga atlantica TaxID=1548457 RepID=A0A937DK91_9BACT|nr:hypothetical protein [Marivirga atlantica]MBL0765754.1 hypothetical protein [Marivirga atlantica]
MQELILGILRKIELDKEYLKLCQNHHDFDGRANLNRKEIEPIIKSFDSDFKYVAKDRTFLKETPYEEFTLRFFIGFKNGIIDFSYLVWKEGENHNFYQGRLATLAEQIDPEFKEKVKYKTPIATSLEDFKEILSKYFELFESFKQHFQETVKS